MRWYRDPFKSGDFGENCVFGEMVQMANNRQIVHKISNEMARDASESGDFGENGGFGENAFITAMIFFHIILHPAVLIYDFHIFITSRQSLSTTVPFWTTPTCMIILHLLNNVKEKNNVIS